MKDEKREFFFIFIWELGVIEALEKVASQHT